MTIRSAAGVSLEDGAHLGLCGRITIDLRVHEQEKDRPTRAVGRGGVEAGVALHSVGVDDQTGEFACVGGDEAPSECDGLCKLVGLPGIEGEAGVGIIGDEDGVFVSAGEEFSIGGCRCAQVVPLVEAGRGTSKGCM